MKTLTEIKTILHKQKPHLTQKYGVNKVGVFGSFVRGEQTDKSDLDILIDLEKPIKIDLLDFIEMEKYLSTLLGLTVDLSIKEDLKPRIGQRILQEVVMI